VIVNLTYRCNNRCVFCAVGDRTARDADPRQVEQALCAYRDKGYELLDIDGGEPTLHPSLFAIIGEGRRLGYRRITVVTNGRRLSYPAYARGLVHAGVDEVLVSLHAHRPGLQAQITRVDDSFGQTTAGIRNMLELLDDPDRLAVNTTIVRHNLDDLAALGTMLAGLGVRRWNLQVVTPFGRAEANQLPDQDRLGETLRAVLSRPPAAMHIQVINCPPCLLGEHEESAAVDFGKAGRDMVFVGERGENLQAFLAHRRAQDERCAGCLWAILCPGFYLFEPAAPPETS
jgi:MoaA/NifB/PqqE/SkfB family radical SAM enzyme